MPVSEDGVICGGAECPLCDTNLLLTQPIHDDRADRPSALHIWYCRGCKSWWTTAGLIEADCYDEGGSVDTI